MSELAPILELPTEKEDFDARFRHFGENINNFRILLDSCTDPDERERILMMLQRIEAQFDYLLAHYPDRGDEEPAAPYIL